MSLNSPLVPFRMPDRVPEAVPWTAPRLISLGAESGRLRPAGHQEIANEDLHGFVPLVERRRAHFDETLSGPRPRHPHLEHFALQMQLIVGPHRPRPTKLIKPEANDAARRSEFTLD